MLSENKKKNILTKKENMLKLLNFMKKTVKFWYMKTTLGLQGSLVGEGKENIAK